MNLILESERLILRVLLEDQAALTADFYRRNWRFLALWEPNIGEYSIELEAQRNTLRYEFEQLRQGHFIRYWYAPKNQPDLLYGTVCFQTMLPHPFSHCEIGYKQDQRCMGQGYATEAACTAIGHLFADAAIHRIEALAECQNFPSIRLLERLGFAFEGIARQTVYLRNAWQDCNRYALINPASQKPLS